MLMNFLFFLKIKNIEHFMSDSIKIIKFDHSALNTFTHITQNTGLWYHLLM